MTTPDDPYRRSSHRRAAGPPPGRQPYPPDPYYPQADPSYGQEWSGGQSDHQEQSPYPQQPGYQPPNPPGRQSWANDPRFEPDPRFGPQRGQPQEPTLGFSPPARYAQPQPWTTEPSSGYRPQPGYQQPQPYSYPPPQNGGLLPGSRAQQQAKPRRKRRIFLWVFLAVQVLFILWLVEGLATTHTGATQAQLAQGCYNHAWYPLFKSQADCVQHYGGALQDAGNAGKAIGAGIIVLMWVVVDFFLGVGYGVYKLATR